MQKLTNASLKNYTSFHSGGTAEVLYICESSNEIKKVIEESPHTNLTILGYGTNVLISDHGLKGVTILTRGGKLECIGDELISDAGVWWDDLVALAEENQLWGVELMNSIPSSIGGAVMGNIAAYGQQISDTLLWVEVMNYETHEITQIAASSLIYGYRYCSVSEMDRVVILRAAFRLNTQATKKLEYGSALRVAEEFGYDPEAIKDRRKIIIEARRRAGSLYDPAANKNSYTAGSFFKNPVVSLETAKKVITFDETGKSPEVLLKQNQIHGGSDHRVSAAHVLLAAGFTRGQTWGNVRLHPEHILKIENTGHATSQEIYEVAHNIMETVNSSLGIELEPEVRFLGIFN